MQKYQVIIDDNGTIEWHQNGKLHRVDGPAIEYPDGRKDWLSDGKRHREDGPAVEYANGNKAWWINGKLHREDGPAVEWITGTKEWWINGEQLTEDKFNNQTKPIKELSISELQAILGYKIKIVE